MADHCLNCAEPATVRHHVIPRSRGGRGTVPLCADCHALAHRSSLSELRAESHREQTASGKHSGGLPPYGYAVVSGRLVADASEQAAVNAILALRLEDKSYAEIAAILTDRKFKPRGSAWNVSAIRKIVIRYFGPTAAE